MAVHGARQANIRQQQVDWPGAADNFERRFGRTEIENAKILTFQDGFCDLAKGRVVLDQQYRCLLLRDLLVGRLGTVVG